MAATTVYGAIATKLLTTGLPANMLLPSDRARHIVVVDAKTVATTSIDEVGDITIFGAIPSRAIIRSIRIFNGDLDTNGSPTLTFRVGLYYLNGNGVANAAGTEIGTNVITSTAQTTLQAANTAGVELYYINRSLVADYQKRAWEIAGLTADCGGFLGIGLKVVGVSATPAAGDVLVQIAYVLE